MMKLEGALYPWRFRLMIGLLALMVGAIAWRIIDLQVVDRDFLIGQGVPAACVISRFLLTAASSPTETASLWP